MTYVTVFTRQVRRRATKRLETIGVAYQTKSLTDYHKFLRDTFPDAQTWKDPKRVVTDFVPGMNLGTLPIVRGGERIA